MTSSALDPLLLGNVIFPVFSLPYVTAFFYWPLALLALVAELVVELVFLEVSWRRIVAGFLLGNAASTVIGVMLTSVLPSGFEAGAEVPTRVSHWFALAVASWAVAYVLSVGIQAAILALLARRSRGWRLVRIVAAANAASYGLLILPAL